jgi:uncharacterized protein (DUF302 family)
MTPKEETTMIKTSASTIVLAVLTAIFVTTMALVSDAGHAATPPSSDGIVKVKSAYAFGETVDRLKKDVEVKGIKFFTAVDQSQLGHDAGIKLNPSTLLIFGNPPLGIQFLTSNPNAGLDWPVRLLVTQDEKGQVWAVYTDFGWIAKRHNISDRDAAFKMASDVIASIVSSVEKN